jgi:hypothetical protein
LLCTERRRKSSKKKQKSKANTTQGQGTTTMTGPLFWLRWYGGLCPCLESAEDKGARLALELLRGLTVKWHRTGLVKKIGGIVAGWFGKSESDGKKDDAVEAKLKWADTDGGPELHIKPASASYSKTIPLKQLDRVLLKDDSFLVLQSEKERGTYQDLATLEVVVGDANEVKEAITQMIEWDGRRRAAIPDDERELDEEQGIKARAQKAAHFAKREIELQQQRRDREKRKAALVKDTGGLKYTALAMAKMDET